MIGARPLVGAALLAFSITGDALADGEPSQWIVDPVDEVVPETATHFLVGNEARHDLFTAAIAGRGGAYLGVGGDQNYTLIAVARAERAFILDHDRKILELHRELGRRIIAAATAQELLRGLADRADIPPALADAWPSLVTHLSRVAARRHAGRPTTWLGDPALYAIVRELWRRGSIHLVLADLAGDVAMPSVAAAAASRGLLFSVVYLSNTGDTLSAPQRLVDHLRRLPRSAGAVVLRTVVRAGEPAADGLWTYQIERLGPGD